MKAGTWFIVGLLAFGVVSGFVVAASPTLRGLPLPSLVWPLAASFLADLALLPAARAGRIEPITFNQRAIGVVGGTLAHMAVLALAAPAAV
jgi:hypothetical protein